MGAKTVRRLLNHPSPTQITQITVRRNIQASGEPLTPEVAQLLRMRPEDNHSAPSVSETWQNQHKRRQYAEWFNDTWQATNSYSGTGRPIDGLIMYAPSQGLSHALFRRILC